MDAGLEVQKQQELADRLGQIAGRGWSRVFANCEMEMTVEGMVFDWIAFSVEKSLLGKLRRNPIEFGAEEFRLLESVGWGLMQRASVSRLTLDILISNDGQFRFFVDYDETARIGGDLSRTDRHRRYADDDPVLARLASSSER